MGSKENPVTALGGVIVGKSPYTLESGAMHIASKNVVLREVDKLESRRGIERMMRGLRWDKLFSFGSTLLAHQLDADGSDVGRFNSTFTTITTIGTAQNPSTRKIQTAAAGGRFFMTTGQGVKVLDSITDTLRTAGGPIAPGKYSAAVTATAGWLVTGFKVAYRYTIGRVTTQGLQVIGPPSGRFYLTGAGGTFTTQLVLMLPPGLDDTHFIQVWRSAQVASAIEPDDDLRLVYERAITRGEASAKTTALIEDVVTDALRGEFLYTNPNSGDGIQQANDPPPLAEEVVLHKDRLWLGRTTQPYSFSFKLIAVGGAGGISANDIILITSQTPALQLREGIDFSVYTAGSASENIQRTAQAIVDGINTLGLGTGVNENTSVWAEYTSSPDDALGEIRIYGRDALTGPFDVYVDQRTGGAAWTMRSAFAPEFLPYLPGIGTALTFSLTRTLGSTVTATISSGNLTNALRVGDAIYINPGSVNFGVGPFPVAAIGPTTFTYAEPGANVTLVGQTVTMATDNIAAASQDSFINRIHYSKPFEFEAFPRGDYAEVGASDKGIIAMRVTRETLWVFKEDGLFRITGDDASTFDVERMDATVIALASECVQPFAESVIAWTTKGIVILSESSFDIISDDIDHLLRNYIEDDASRATSWLPDAFMVVDEKDGIVRLHLPGQSEANDAVPVGAGEALVYSVKTKTWARWEWPQELAKVPKPLTHGLVNPLDRRVFYVDRFFVSAGEGFLWRERPYADASTYLDDDVTNPTGAAGTFVISCSALWVAQFNKAPMRDKRWDEVALLFGQPTLPGGTIRPPGAFSYGFGNENSEQGDSLNIFGLLVPVRLPSISVVTSATPVSPVVRVMVPINQSRGQRLWIRIDHAANEEFTLHGFQLLAEVLNAAIGR